MDPMSTIIVLTVLTMLTIILLICFFLYMPLYVKMNRIRNQITVGTRILFGSYIILMLIFIFASVYIGILVLLNIWVQNMSVVGPIVFFFGGVFILASIIVQRKLVSVIDKTNLQIISSLIKVVEARDQNLKGHSTHVVAISLLIYDNLPPNYKRKINRQKLEYAGLLHDIGKLGIPEIILNKNGPLNDNEWTIMRDHTRISKNILSEIDNFADISDWVFYHHERTDGNGYYKIKEKSIPLASKIITVADTYSAIVMKRSYKEAREHSEAMSILKDIAGTQLDPFIVSIFSNIDQSEIIKRNLFIMERVIDKF